MRSMSVKGYYPKLDGLANRSDNKINELTQRNALPAVNHIANLSWMFGTICIIIEE
jgi:hypothetical protein